jgi:hypothetical protein
MSTKEVISWPTFLSIPTKWNESDKSPHLIVSPNGKDVTFSGMPFSPAWPLHLICLVGNVSPLETQNAAAVRAECPIPPACGIYYYEVTVIDRGNKGYV